jgi:adenylate kinase
MIVVFLGAPGSGKGTQAKLISQKYNLEHLSTGDMLRKTAKTETELGKKLSKILASGALVDDEMVNNIVKQTLSQSGLGYIVDGYPRTAEQANFLSGLGLVNIRVIYFDISTEELKQRITQRYTCSKCGAIYNSKTSPTIIEGVCDICSGSEFERRADDNENSLVKRINMFEDNLSSLLEFYNNSSNFFTINAKDSVDSIFAKISKIIDHSNLA